MSKTTFAIHLSWLLIALLAYIAGSKRGARPELSKNPSQKHKSADATPDQPSQSGILTATKSPRSGVPKAKRDTAGHSVDQLRDAGAELLEPFANYEDGDDPFADFDRLDPKDRANAIRGILFSSIGSHDDFAEKLMSVLSQHNFSGIDRDTLDGIFDFIIADQFTDKTPMQAEALRRLRNGRHIP